MESRRHHKLLTVLSLSRVFLAIASLIIFRNDPSSSAVVMGLAIVAQITDHLDGYIARKYSTPTLKGDMIDSVSDKAMQFALTIAICREFQLGYTIAWIAFMREVLVLSIRIISSPTGKIRSAPKWMSRLYAGSWRIFLLVMIVAPITAGYGIDFQYSANIAQLVYFLSLPIVFYSIFIELKYM